MLCEQLHTGYEEFSQFCEGRLFTLELSFEDIKSRLIKFNEINAQIVLAEAEFIFNNESDEIKYYKDEKSEFQKYGIYYEMIYNIELKRRPITYKYYKKLLKQLDREFLEIEHYVIYYRSDCTDKDVVFFKKESKENHIIALVKANQMLTEYLAHKSGGKTADEIIAGSPKVKFKLKQNDIMELAKGFKGIGAAEGTIKDIAETMGRFFGVDMKNVHSKGHVIANRLKPVRFLEELFNWLKKNI